MVTIGLRFGHLFYRCTMSSSRRLSAIRNHVHTCQGHSCDQSYSTSANNQNNERLLETLSSSSSGSKESTVYQFIKSYKSSSDSDRRSLLEALASKYGGDPASVITEVDHLKSIAQSSELQASYQRQVQKVKASLICPYEKIFRTISSFPGGVKFLVDLRADVNKFTRESTGSSKVTDLQSINMILKEVGPLSS